MIARACFVALLVLFAQVVTAGAIPGLPKAGDPAPSYLGRDTTHDNDVHVEDLRGKVVIVTFWASWCKYCLKEMPILAGIQKLTGPNQLQVVAISYKDDYDDFRRIHHNLRKTSIVMTYDGQSSIGAAYHVTGLPHMVMIGRDGRIAYVHEGYDESMLDTIANEVNTLLAAPAPAQASTP